MAWSRADKINGFMATTALATAVITAIPVANSWLDRQNRPAAKIVIPSDNTKHSGDTVAVEGTSSKIPHDGDLWLVVRSDGRWFPVDKCVPSPDGRWSFREDDVHLGDPDEAGLYTLSVYLAEPAQTGEFANYVQRRQTGKDSGLVSLPDGVKLMDSNPVMRVK